MINIPKGTKDVLPYESYKWHYVEGKAREIAQRFNIKEIRTPTFEHTELFLRGVGDTTDIVNKEMYTFLDKGERSITLKPEGTAGVARAFIENGLGNNPLPLKMYYITPVFRYERPQAGRLREHHQFGIEFYGSTLPSIDAEVIVVANTILNELGLEVELNINSIGCKDCRKKYNLALREFLNKKRDCLCDTCKERLEKNPLRVLDCKNPQCQENIKDAPIILDYLCEDCKEHFASVQKYLKASGINFKINPRIVRGLDYYTRTIFEFVTTSLGAQGTVCGGGRYDGLIEQIGGNPTAGIGFGMGLERIIMLMENTGVVIPENENCDLYIASFGEKGNFKAFEIANQLRKEGISVEIDHLGRSFKAQFKYADKIKAKYIVAIGDNEIETQRVKIKDTVDWKEEEIDIDKILKYIKG